MKNKINLFQKDAEKFLSTIEATDEMKNFIMQSAHAADKNLDPEYRKQRKRATEQLLNEEKQRRGW